MCFGVARAPTVLLLSTLLSYHGWDARSMVDCSGKGMFFCSFCPQLMKAHLQVLATDANEKQLAQAIQRPNVEYCFGTAEKIPADESTADLITVAQALHW